MLLSVVAFYGYYKFFQIPESILTGVVFLPVLLVLLVIGLCFHFNRSQIFFYTLLVIISNLVLGMHWADTGLSYALLSGFIPLLLLVFSLLPDRGILSLRALPAYIILLLVLLVSMLVLSFKPVWAVELILTDWLPARYFDWTQQSQSVVLTSVFVFIYMLVLYFTRPSSHLAAGLGVLLMLIAQLHFGDDSDSLNMFSNVALLMCLYAIIQESWRMAYLDELTDLPTRRALREKFQQTGGLYTVAMLDVDHFKKFNDTYGHDTGDAVLRMIATKIRKVSGGGAAYRYGGEEFTVVFNGKNIEDASQHLELLREKIANTPFVINRASRRKNDRKTKQSKNKSVKVTVSIGMADSQLKAVSGNTASKSHASTASRSPTKSAPKSSPKSPPKSPWDILKLADKALYRAKNKGRNCVSS